MLARVLGMPKLTDAVARADVEGEGSYDVTPDGRGGRDPRGRADRPEARREGEGAHDVVAGAADLRSPATPR